MIVRNRFFPLGVIFVHGFDIQVFVFHQPGSDGARWRVGCALDHGEVGSVHFSVVELLLQFAFRRGVLCQHHNAGRVLVKTVDDVTPSVLVLMLQVVNAAAVKSVHFKPVRRH